MEHKFESPSIEDDYVFDLAFSHNGCRILCIVKGMMAEWTITGHRLFPPGIDNDWFVERLLSVAYSPNDREIVYGMCSGTIMIWNTETKKRRKLGTHSGEVTSISFSPNGSCLASGSDDKTVRIWDPLARTFAEEMDLGWLNHVALSHDGQWIVTASRNHIQVWKVTETITKANKLRIKAGVESVALSRDGSRVVIGCRDGSIWVWNHLTNTIQRQKSGHSNRVWSVIWNHMTKRQIRGHSNWVECVAFSYNGSHVVSGSGNWTVRIWNWHTRKGFGLYQYLDWVTCVAFSRDGGRVAFGSYDGTWIWNLSTGEIHSEPDNKSQSQGWVHSVAFSHNGNHVISGREDGVWIWNVTTNESTMLSERIKLPDGTRVHSLSKGDFHIYDPVDQEMTNGIPPYLFSISPGRDWINGEQREHICWIPPQYRDFFKVHIARSIVCLYTRWHGMIILDLKHTPHAECVMSGVRVSPG